MHLRVLQVRIRNRIHAALREEAVGTASPAAGLNEGIAARIPGPGIRQREGTAGARQRRTPWRIIGNARVEEHVGHVIEQAVGGADGSLAVAEGIPYHAQSRQQVVGSVIVLVVRRIAWVTREDEA